MILNGDIGWRDEGGSHGEEGGHAIVWELFGMDTSKVVWDRHPSMVIHR